MVIIYLSLFLLYLSLYFSVPPPTNTAIMVIISFSFFLSYLCVSLSIPLFLFLFPYLSHFLYPPSLSESLSSFLSHSGSLLPICIILYFRLESKKRMTLSKSKKLPNQNPRTALQLKFAIRKRSPSFGRMKTRMWKLQVFSLSKYNYEEHGQYRIERKQIWHRNLFYCMSKKS